MTSSEHLLRELAKQAKTGSHRTPLVPVLTSAPTNTPAGTQWASTAEGSISVATDNAILKLSPFRAGRFRSSPLTVLPVGEGAATFFDIQIKTPRPCFVRTLVELLIEPTPGGGIGGTRTYNNGWAKSEMRTFSPAAVVEADSLKRPGQVQDDGGGTYFGSSVSMQRLWNFSFLGPSTNYFLRILMWRQFTTCSTRVNSIDVQFDFVDVIA